VAGSTAHAAAASSTRAWRAAAAARRTSGAMNGVVRLPKVPMSKGVRAVSAMSMVTLAGATRSSSATAWVSDVRMFCPSSALPVKAVTAPSSPTWIHAAISSGGSSAPAPPRRPDSCPGASAATATSSPAATSFSACRRSSSKR
jgi:hypothetical protein